MATNVADNGAGGGAPSRSLDKNYLEKYSSEQMKMLEAVRQEVAYYDVHAVEYIADTMKWKNDKENASSEVNQIDAMNKVYARGLLEQAARPILQSRGRNPEAVWSSVGIMIGGYLTNPEFRKMVDSGVGKALYPSIKAKSDSAGPDSKWHKWCERIEKNQNDGRIPLTPRSAAIMKLGLDRKYYRELREPGADSAALMKEYSKAYTGLYSVAELDGISADDINKNVRTLVGQMQNVDPSVARVYNETAQGTVKKGAGTYNEKEKTTYWQGQFEYKDGASYGGGFTVRMPTNDFQWVSVFNQSMSHAFGRCKTAEDVMDLGNVARGGKAPKGKEWMEGWQRRNERDYDIMKDDCRTVKDREMLDSYAANIAESHFKDWMLTHPTEAAKFAKQWQAQNGGQQAGKSAGAGYSAPKSENLVPPERRLDVPPEIMGDDYNPPEPVYGNY